VETKVQEGQAVAGHLAELRILERLGYTKPNTAAIEPRNETARRMSAHQVRRSLAFARRPGLVGGHCL
jgi:hypothetical protein